MNNEEQKNGSSSTRRVLIIAGLAVAAWAGFKIQHGGPKSAVAFVDQPSVELIPTKAAVSDFSYLPEYAKHFKRPDSIPFPSDNQWSAARENLGHMLFFDPRLSGSGSQSCASCHNPSFGWGDSLPVAVGSGMNKLGRRTPTVLNLAWTELLFWDGRASSLEEQALGPIQSKGEMNMDLNQMIVNLQKIQGYREAFEAAYPGTGITKENVGKAIATFEHKIVSADAPFDHYLNGDESAISQSAKRGFALFNGKANCVSCHSGWNFSDGGFHDIGVAGADKGRAAVLPLPSMNFAFKTPGLRNIVERAPYMHDGTEATLEDVIEFYDVGGREKRASLSPMIKPLGLTSQEKSDLVAFLKTLSSNDTPMVVPNLPR